LIPKINTQAYEVELGKTYFLIQQLLTKRHVTCTIKHNEKKNTGIAYFLIKYIQTTQSSIIKKDVLQTDTPIAGLASLGDTIIICTHGGKIIALNTQGDTQWETKIDSSIFNISENTEEEMLIVAGVNFYIFNKKGEEVLKKELENYIGIKGKFLSNGNIKLVYQSLTDLSYIVVTIDKTGKTLFEEEIPDLGESSQIDISNSGKLLFAGERGELYLINEDMVENSALIETEKGNFHSIFGYFVEDSIVAGFRLSEEENTSVPVFFYSADLQSVTKVLLNSKINNISLHNNLVTFATENEFITFDQNGKELNKMLKLGFSALNFSSNNDVQLCFYKKSLSEKNKKNIYYISLIKDNKEILKYLFPSDSIPSVCLSSKEDLIFIIDGNKLIFIY